MTDKASTLREAIDSLREVTKDMDLPTPDDIFNDRRGWLDIETAPRDHFILLGCPEDRSVWLAKWQGGEWYGVDDRGLTRSGHSHGDPNNVTGWFVTHWQPLPEAPR